MKPGLRYGIYALAFMVALGLAAYGTVWFIVRGQPEVTVPDLVGKDAVESLKILADIGLNLKVRGIEYSDSVPRDHVLSQDPEPGAQIKPKREIKVTLSKGSASVRLPDLRGLPLEQARAILEQTGLKSGQISYSHGYGPEYGRDRVMAQNPDPLAVARVGTPVHLLLSLGPQPDYLIMPDLTGLPYSLAILNLERAGLKLGSIRAEVRPSWPTDAVIIQDPPSGGRVAKSTLVRLTVNRENALPQPEYRLQLLEYAVPYGLFRREIKIRVAAGPYVVDLHDDWYEAGDTVRVVALSNDRLRVQIFEDGEERLPAGGNDVGSDFQFKRSF